jgi:hypothetical protein
MQKLIIVFLVCFILSSCSLVKTIVAPFKSTQTTLPQQTEQSKKKEMCKGKYTLNSDGTIISCEKGYYNYEMIYNQKERKLTLKEKIVQYFDKLIGWSFWIVILLVIFCPSVLGFIFGRIIEGIYGIGNKALKQITKAVQSVKDTTPTLISALKESTDQDVKDWLKNFKQKNNID